MIPPSDPDDRDEDTDETSPYHEISDIIEHAVAHGEPDPTLPDTPPPAPVPERGEPAVMRLAPWLAVAMILVMVVYLVWRFLL